MERGSTEQQVGELYRCGGPHWQVKLLSDLVDILDYNSRQEQPLHEGHRTRANFADMCLHCRIERD